MVEHVPQVGVVCMLHEDLAETLYEPSALCAVPVSHIARKGGVCDENVLPTKLRLMRGPRTRPVTPLKNHPCIRCTATSFFMVGSHVWRIVDTIVLFFPSAGLDNEKLWLPLQLWAVLIVEPPKYVLLQ